MAQKFWNFQNSEEGRTLYFDGIIAMESWYDDEITPKKFKAELLSGEGDVNVLINSVGGDVFAASQIYNMLKEYKGKVTIKIDSIAASAASLIAMSGDEVHISPCGFLMIHNPATLIFGETSDLQSGINMLEEIKEGIINAYEEKTGLNRNKISKMMDAETWLSAKKAVELGFADSIMYTEEKGVTNQNNQTKEGIIYDKETIVKAIMKKLPNNQQTKPITTVNKEIETKQATKQETPLNNQLTDTKTPYNHLKKRLELIK